MRNDIILVTGSSGYVGRAYLSSNGEKHTTFTIDMEGDEATDLNINLLNINEKRLADLESFSITVLNLAAARDDIGLTAQDYYENNVEAQIKFLDSLENLNVIRFIHICSVAAIDGEKIEFKKNLGCDDAYRSTKYLQQRLISSWCEKRDVPLIRILPSAIFSRDARGDTNIGTLQRVCRYLPFIPLIPTQKSLTFLPNLVDFIDHCIRDKDLSGGYLAIEKPVLSVSDILFFLSAGKKRVVRVPGLRLGLKFIAWALEQCSIIFKVDLKLRPSRVVKLYSDTSYASIGSKSIDNETYRRFVGSDSLGDILASLSGKHT